MALILDYEFDNFSTAADGTRKVVDASGNSNDGTMESGQGLEFDGIDDYINTDIYVDPSYKTCIVSFKTANTLPATGCLAYGGDWAKYRRFGFFVASGKILFEYGDKYFYGSALSTNTNYRAVVTYDGVNAIGYLDSVQDAIVAASQIPSKEISSGFTFRFGDINDWIYSGDVLMCTILDVNISSDDVIYDFNNPNAIIEMLITGTANPNFSFLPSNILHCFTFDESTGNVIHDIVTGKSYSMLNFPSDNTQWTNADLQPYGHQKLRFKKDANGNPSALADTKTVRFD